jgi:2,4-dienoyl-CoA reductase-like NADH-dependent reductase (Old Yellow Enzyme family)
VRFLLEVVDAVIAVVGAERTGVRISPQNGQNDIADGDPQRLFNHVASALSGRGLAYLHTIEGDTGGTPVPPFDYGRSSAASAGSSSPITASTKSAPTRRSRKAAPISSPSASRSSATPTS